MIILSVALFALAGFLYLGKIATRCYENRLKHALVVEAKVENCEKFKEKRFGRIVEFYAIKYGFCDANGKYHTLTQEEKDELVAGEKVERILLGKDIDSFTLCPVEEKMQKRSNVLRIIGILSLLGGIILLKPTIFKNIYDWVLNVDSNSLNDCFAIVVLCLGFLTMVYAIAKVFQFNMLKHKALSYCDEKIKSKATIIEVYKGKKSEKYILKTKNKKGYTEESIEVCEGEKDTDMLLDDRMDKGFFKFWIFMGVLIMLAGFALHFV